MNIAIASAGELYGGAEQFILDFASALSRMREHRVRVLLFSAGMLEQKLRAESVPVTVIPTAFKYDWGASGRVREALRADRIEIAHVHGYKANLICAPAARSAGAAVVKTEHGAMEPFGTWTGRMKMHLNLALDRQVTRHFVRHVVYVSKDMQRRAAGARGTVASSVIYNGIRPIDLNGSGRPAEFEAGKFHLGIIGRLSPVKGHADLLKALGALSDLPIAAHVFGDGELAEPLKKQAGELGLGDRVRFHGFRRDIHRCLSGLDLLVMPSLHEGFPYTLLEASFLGVPFIASQVGGIAEVFENEKDCLLVRPRDADGLAAALRRAFEDAGLRSRLSSAAQAKVKKDFMLVSMTRRYLELFETLRERKPE